MTDLVRRASALAAELKRRHVVRVAIAYIAAAWIAIQGASTIVPALHLAEAVTTVVVVLAILGFPISMVLAWAYDITPQGVRRTPDEPESGQAEVEATSRGVRASGATAGGSGHPADGHLITESRLDLPLAAIPLHLATAPANGVGARAATPMSIAALPFVDLSPTTAGAPADRFWGDGITEELTNALARVNGLRVVSRTSAFALREQVLDVRDIGRRLGAGLLVEGSVRVVGDRLRLTARLVDVSDGLSLWSAQFDRGTGDIFSVQEEVARAIVEHVRGSVSGEGQPASAGGKRDLGAYTHYLAGRHFWRLRTPDALRTATERFEAAIHSDPHLAAAHAGLADCLGILMEYGLLAPVEVLERARGAARRAVELDAGSAEARSALGLVHQIAWEWPEAESALTAALALDPSHGGARQRYALLLAWMGRQEEAERQIAAALEIDPLAPAIAASAAWIDYYGGRLDRAAAGQRQVLQAHPEMDSARIGLALAHVAGGHPDRAVEELRQAAVRPDASAARALLAFALARDGQLAAARQVVVALHASSDSHLSPYYLAVARLALEGPAQALDTLEQAADRHAPQLVYLAVEPLFRELREHPRFQDLVVRIGLGSSASPHSTTPSLRS